MSNTAKTPCLSLIGITISDCEALLQAICPGKSCTLGTITTSLRFQAVPQTPFPLLIRVQAIDP